MSGSSIQIVGFISSYKNPGFFGETVYGSGAISLASIPLVFGVFGLKHDSLGSMTADGSPVPIYSADDADTNCGAGGELARMCYAALHVPGIKLFAGAFASAGGAAASVTITFVGTATSTGNVKYRVGGDQVDVAIANGATPTVIAASVRDAFLAKSRYACTASASAGVVTLTIKSAGVRGNQYILFQDVSGIATSVTSTLAGGASVTGSGVKFAGGTGADDATNILATIFSSRFNRIAIAQNDATNLGRWKTQLNNKAGPLEGRMEHAIFATNGTQSAAASLTTTTLNNARFQNLWLLNSERHPSELAAVMGALRTATEQDDPDAAYDGAVLPGMNGQTQVADIPNAATQSSCLDNGVTPLSTNAQGQVVVVRSIGTHCLNGTDPDYRTLDTSDAVVPDYVRDGLSLIWSTEFVVQNKRVADNPAEGQRDRPAGVATPERWSNRAMRFLHDLEAATILIDVDSHPVSSEYNATAKRIMSIAPVVPAPNQHQIGVSVRQVA